ncbi:MAG: class I SAM-dependent methyltransferase [Gemmatimonadales bacterium]|nr:class I SAM-dependent methyltransferase [Gemmatimonadales bacterium]
MPWHPIEASFRDPSGFVYHRDGTLYRQVNRVFAQQFDACVASGLYDELTAGALLVPHRRAGIELAADPNAHAVLEPELVSFISYPYEWSFGQLKDAALLTLDIQTRALTRGFTLRDASAYNVQFHRGRPLFIDTLSFEPHQEGTPWAAYKQFCEHFLLPLALMSGRDVRCGSLLRVHLDGIPLDLGSALLPRRTWLRPGSLLHLHLHAKAQSRYAEAKVSTATKGRTIARRAVLALVESLRRAVDGCRWQPSGTEWAEYTSDNNYTAPAAASKRRTVLELLRGLEAGSVWDVGANTGEYSRAARESASVVVAFDLDPAAVERNYRRVRQDEEPGILPLLMDLTNPSPAQGWGHRERLSLEQRGPADAVLALALVHHLAIGHNLPLPKVAEFFARIARNLVIEFVPKSDSQVRRLLRNRPDIFPDYTREGFERAFGERFTVEAVRAVAAPQCGARCAVPARPPV